MKAPRKKKRNKAGKGSDYERVLCKRLSLWWTHNKRDDVFWRTGGSGGRAKGRGRRGSSTYGQHGDMAATDPKGDALIDFLTIEIKRGYSKYTLAEILDKPESAAQQVFESWVQQAHESCQLAGSYSWMLIQKRDQRPPIVFFPLHVYDLFMDHIPRSFAGPIVTMRAGFQEVLVDKQAKRQRVRAHSLVGMLLDSWLQAVTPELIKVLADKV